MQRKKKLKHKKLNTTKKQIDISTISIIPYFLAVYNTIEFYIFYFHYENPSLCV